MTKEIPASGARNAKWWETLTNGEKRAIFSDTEEVTSSNLVTPTIKTKGQPGFPVDLFICHRSPRERFGERFWPERERRGTVPLTVPTKISGPRSPSPASPNAQYRRRRGARRKGVGMDGTEKELDRMTRTEAVELARELGATLDDLAAALEGRRAELLSTAAGIITYRRRPPGAAIA